MARTGDINQPELKALVLPERIIGGINEFLCKIPH